MKLHDNVCIVRYYETHVSTDKMNTKARRDIKQLIIQNVLTIFLIILLARADKKLCSVYCCRLKIDRARALRLFARLITSDQAFSEKKINPDGRATESLRNHSGMFLRFHLSR